MNFTSLRILIAILLLLVFSSGIVAQNTTDSIKPFSKLYSKEYSNNKSGTAIFSTDPLRSKFNAMKLVDMSYEQLSGSDYYMKKKGGEKIESGELNAIRRFKANINYIPLIQKQKFTLSASLRYEYEFMPYDYIDKEYPAGPRLNHRIDTENQYFNGALTFTYRDKLFGKDVVYLASAVADGSKERFENLVGVFAATFTIYKTENTITTLGAYASTSRAAIIPFFPIFTYKHRFGQTQWVFDAELPRLVFIRRMIGENGRISGGMRLGGSHSYIYPGQADFKHTYTYDRLDIKAEIMYEHFIAKNFLASVHVGYLKNYKGVYREKNKKKDFITFSQDPNFYFNVGLAYTLGFR